MSKPPQPAIGFTNHAYILFAGLVVLLAMLWRWTRVYPLPLFDLYPLYYGGVAWLHTGNAYDLTPVVPSWHQPFTVFQIGNGYPLPALLLTLPLTLLPPHIAATLWVGMLTAGLLLALRLHRALLWMLLYLPLLEGLRIEQYTILMVVVQLVALWAYRENRGWLLAFCCALLMTKPTHGALPALALMLLARNWRQQALAIIAIWGSTLLLDPLWLTEWLVAARGYAATAQQPILWVIVILALPLLLARDWVSAAVVAQLGAAPFPGIYAASSLQLGLLHDHRCRWLSLISFLWAPAALLLGKPAATVITLAIPVVCLALLRWREQMRRAIPVR